MQTEKGEQNAMNKLQREKSESEHTEMSQKGTGRPREKNEMSNFRQHPLLVYRYLS